MGVLDPRLRSLLATRAHHEERVRTRELAREDAPDTAERVGVLVKYKGDVADLKALGLVVGSVLGNPSTDFEIATGTIALEAVEALAAVDHVVKVEMGRRLHDELDISTVEIRAKPLHSGPAPLTGRRVVVGVIDSGLDYRHHAFRLPNDDTRFLFIWNQDISVRPRGPTDPFQETAPPEFPTVGVEYTDQQINQALRSSNPLNVVRLDDTESAHGTAVTGIAAGDGSQAGTREGSGDNCTGANTYIGVAPGADIIFVRHSKIGDQIGESQNLVDAINYIFTRASQLDGGAGRPCVINISQGDNMGPHDGTSLVEQAIDQMLVLSTRRAIVKSAGNEGGKSRHAMANVTVGGGPKRITFSVPAGANRRQFMECWYDGSQRLDVQLFAPGTPAPSSPVVHPGDAPNVWPVNPNVTVTITSALDDPDNHDNRIFLEWGGAAGANPPNGTWTVQFTNTSGGNALLHCWLENRGDEVPVFTSDVTDSHTISIPGTSSNVITVGSYAAEELRSPSGRVTHNGDLYVSSSRGPKRNGARKPDITAPGVSITSARANSHAGCCCDCCYDFYVDKTGTSFSAPHVTGVIALMFQKNPNLDHLDIALALHGTARDPGDGSVLPNNDWGTGKVDATAAVNAAPAPAAPGGGGGGGGGGGEVVPFWMAPTLDMTDRALFRRLQRFQDWVLGFPAGHLYASLVSRHFDEVLRLINTNRRVATVWHRNGGPSLVRAALAIADDPGGVRLPETANGKPLAPQLERILDSWRRFATPGLVADIDRYRAHIVGLPGCALHDALGPRKSAA
jgi:subtilisin family serine protease